MFPWYYINEDTKLVDLISSQVLAYVAAEQFVKTVKITHDVAKRGVKIASDYAIILTRDSKIRQMFFQVEKDRKPWHH